MKRTLVCVLMVAWSLGSGAQTVNQPTVDMHVVKSNVVMLDCSYEGTSATSYIFWYKKNGQAAPEFILSRFVSGQEKTVSSFDKRFSCSMNASAQRAPLVIEDVQLNDSAIFYCALKPTVTDSSAAHAQKLLYSPQVRGSGAQTVNQPTVDMHVVKSNVVMLDCSYKGTSATSYIFWYKKNGSTKLFFGSGTRLAVEAKEDWEPSFYKLDKLEGNVTACLATGFSRQNAMETAGKGDVFQGSHAVRILGDSLYNQVTLLSAEHGDSCEKGDSGPGWCQDALAPDEKVNLVSLTVLVLRFVFAKTLAINGVMTLRLWLAVPQ
ncbi:T cell receptor alpha chain MC.7.G5-like [Dunckerocampus dactyliophorus]|uniref:T cell receptor alpha chain MC.7.G5-like n=1 Tax=Dunckerocampus dactyliophorus TaxID=161453 RepID=UPI002405D00A|nr:T cell receptor alpha chain MC.7.G5-like [Dunckerocampus dactyliophorus]